MHFTFPDFPPNFIDQLFVIVTMKSYFEYTLPTFHWKLEIFWDFLTVSHSNINQPKHLCNIITYTEKGQSLQHNAETLLLIARTCSGDSNNMFYGKH